MLSFCSRKRSPPSFSSAAYFSDTVQSLPAEQPQGARPQAALRLRQRLSRHIAGRAGHLARQAAIVVDRSTTLLVAQHAGARLGGLLEGHVERDLGLEHWHLALE